MTNHYTCYKKGTRPQDGVSIAAISELDARRTFAIKWDLPIEEVIAVAQDRRQTR